MRSTTTLYLQRVEPASESPLRSIPAATAAIGLYPLHGRQLTQLTRQ